MHVSALQNMHTAEHAQNKCLLACVASAANEQRIFAACLEHVLEACLNLIHDFEERGVHVSCMSELSANLKMLATIIKVITDEGDMFSKCRTTHRDIHSLPSSGSVWAARTLG
jgi:hypothetical protein